MVMTIFSVFLLVGEVNGETWNLVNSQGFHWDVAYGDGLFVAVGDNGLIKTSPNGEAWTTRNSGTILSLRGVTYSEDHGLFVVVGYNGLILTSPNGIYWTKRQSGTTVNFWGVGCGNHRVVVVGDSGAIYTSYNCTSWTQRTSGVTKRLYDVAFCSNIDGGVFVVVGASGTLLKGSLDAISWARKSTPLYNLYLYGVASDCIDFFVVVAQYGRTMTSNTGNTWTQTRWGVHDHLYGVTYGSSQFIAVGYNGDILSSPNGASWVEESSPTIDQLRGVAYGNSRFVAVGQDVIVYSD